MKDFNPRKYRYNENTLVPAGNCGESTPAEFRYYRAVYAQFIENEHGDRKGADITRQSLAMHSLNEASANSLIAVSIISHLFNQIERLTETPVQEDESDADSEGSGDDSKNKEEDNIDHMSSEDYLEETETLAAPLSIDSQPSSTAGDEADNKIDPDEMDTDVQDGISDGMEEDDESGKVADGPTDLGRFIL